MTESEEIREKLQSGLTPVQVIKQGHKRWLVYKINREISKGIKREISSKDSKVSGENDLNENVDIENDSDIMALKKALRKAELQKQISEMVVSESMELKITAIEEKMEKITEMNDFLFDETVDIRTVLRETPLAGIRSTFKCKCGAKGLLGVLVHCTDCGTDTSFGWFSE
ncbi:hypothetical protein ACFLTB_04485 [Chloroflexota bacterium]